MFKWLYDSARQLVFLTHEMRTARAKLSDTQREVRQLAEEIGKLTRKIERMEDTSRHERENERHEREKLVLRLQNELLRAGRQLPPPTDA